MHAGNLCNVVQCKIVCSDDSIWKVGRTFPANKPALALYGLPAQGPWEFAHWQNVGPLALALHGQPSLSLQEALALFYWK